MNQRSISAKQKQYRGRSILFRGLQVLLIAVMVLGPLLPVLTPPVQAAPLAALTNTLHLQVSSAGPGGGAITDYKFLINIDNTGTTEQRSPEDGCSPANAGYPDTCNWTSIKGIPNSSPIYTQGDASEIEQALADMPDGRYLITVQAAGFKIDGEHFTVPMEDPGNIVVTMQPNPLPTATIRAQVFEDVAPTNSAPDIPAEPGLSGFVGHIFDYIDEVTTDVFGNPLCTEYEMVAGEFVLDEDGVPIPIPGTGGECISDANGELVIPNLGPNRYALSVVPPDGTNWIQTTTLEGNHDWDAWVMEGATGFDTEFVVAGEPFPAIFFGFVEGTPLPSTTPTGEIKGVVMAVKAYIPSTGGTTLPNIRPDAGNEGMSIYKPIEKPWIALSDLNNGDQTIYVGQGNEDGSFDIQHVPDGSYTLAYWDEPQDYLLNFFQVVIDNGEMIDVGILALTGWWTEMEGYVFDDSNRNGVMDPDEHGLANFPVVMKKRENSVMDRGAIVATTDAFGHYYMENVYPMTQWLVMEAYSDQYYTTGITYQADNQNEPTTVLGAGVDVSLFPIIGLGGRMDWGVHAYDADGTSGGLDPRNGGIVGTVSYDTTRNELDPRFAAVEDWQPGISNLTVNLYLPVDCSDTSVSGPCDSLGRYKLAADGSYAQGKWINSYLTETWERPKGCTALDAEGNPLLYPTAQQVLPFDSNDLTTQDQEADCIEGPLMSVQFGPNAADQGTDDASFGASVDGNYGFGDGCFNGTLEGTPDAPVCTGGEFEPLGAGDYLVQVVVPNDPVFDRPLYKPVREEDINIFTGDAYVPQIPPPACAGALHTVDLADSGASDGYDPIDLGNGIIVPASTPTDNADFADGGGSPYEGMAKPLCDTKLVTVSNGRSIAPTFNYFTDVPIPGRFWGLIVDDLNLSNDPRSLLYGEKAGIPFAPVGIYDYTNRLVYTVESDFNGLFDVLLPSTNRISCPTPSGVCANLYRFVGNDPGIPGHLNPNYNPLFRTISAEFEALPGLIVPTDLAPTQVGAMIQVGTGRFSAAVLCTLDSTIPQLFAVSQPYVDLNSNTLSFTINGLGFGASQGTGSVTLGTTALPITSWSDTQIVASVPQGTTPGPYQLKITSGNGRSTVNGLTFHVTGTTVIPFPSTSVLDAFNRAGPFGPIQIGLGVAWAGTALGGDAGFAAGTFRINSNTAQVINTGNTAYILGNYGADQEAYFTFSAVSTVGTEQGLLLKLNKQIGSANFNSTTASWIEVAYNPGSNSTTADDAVIVRTKNTGSTSITTLATFPATFVATNQLGARAAADGTVTVYKNGTPIGAVNVNPWTTYTGLTGGFIGVRFTGVTSSNSTRFDNFGGGNVSSVSAAGYNPTLLEVGPGKPYSTVQSAIDFAATHTTNNGSLIVVYPGTPDPSNPRANPRGAYYENLVMYAPVKLQGVGPGGFQGNTFVPGSILDGGAFGGDTTLADNWRNLIGSLTWLGNQDVYEGQTIFVLAQDTNQANLQFGSTFKAAIDGFDLRGGDQQGFPTNIDTVTGAPTGLGPNAITQGGAIYANAFVRNLQITNNVVENNGGAYGTIRLGTPNLPQPDTNQHNENVRIAYNRIVANGGTNLAGAIGIFAGADNYEVDHNDICGNFSSEYGGALTVYGRSPNGKIHHNRIYFNEAYDEGGAIMIAGELPADPTTLSPGSGSVSIYNNLIESNLSNDDGGGVRFLMAGNFPMMVYNNIIVNNVSTHEGGGIALDDAPDVRIFHNTIMKNLTTATAVTSLGEAAPAGLSTAQNSEQLRATLPGQPLFSPPLLFNNIFWDNRAGTRANGTIVGLGIPGDATAIDHWDLGAADGAGDLAPTNSVIQQNVGQHSYTASLTNKVIDPLVIAPFDTGVTFNAWRTNPAFVDALMTVNSLAVNLGNYHIPSGSSAIDGGAVSKNSVTLPAPAIDIDDVARFTGAGYDIGADELAGTIFAFPSSGVGVLDTFDRPDNASAGISWSAVLTASVFQIQGNQLQVQSDPALDGALHIWNTPSFGSSQEAFFTFGSFDDDATKQGVVLKLTGNPAAYIAAVYNNVDHVVEVWTRTLQQGAIPRGTIPLAPADYFVAGDTLGARATADGNVTVYRNGVKLASTDQDPNPVKVTVGTNPWPEALAAGGGRIGVYFNTPSGGAVSVINDFGGGSMPMGGVIGTLSEEVDPDAGITNFSDPSAGLVAPHFTIGSVLYMPLIPGKDQQSQNGLTPSEQPGEDNTLFLPSAANN